MSDSSSSPSSSSSSPRTYPCYWGWCRATFTSYELLEEHGINEHIITARPQSEASRIADERAEAEMAASGLSSISFGAEAFQGYTGSLPSYWSQDMEPNLESPAPSSKSQLSPSHTATSPIQTPVKFGHLSFSRGETPPIPSPPSSPALGSLVYPTQSRSLAKAKVAFTGSPTKPISQESSTSTRRYAKPSRMSDLSQSPPPAQRSARPPKFTREDSAGSQTSEDSDLDLVEQQLTQREEDEDVSMEVVEDEDLDAEGDIDPDVLDSDAPSQPPSLPPSEDYSNELFKSSPPVPKLSRQYFKGPLPSQSQPQPQPQSQPPSSPSQMQTPSHPRMPYSNTLYQVPSIPGQQQRQAWYNSGKLSRRKSSGVFKSQKSSPLQSPTLDITFAPQAMSTQRTPHGNGSLLPGVYTPVSGLPGTSSSPLKGPEPKLKEGISKLEQYRTSNSSSKRRNFFDEIPGSGSSPVPPIPTAKKSRTTGFKEVNGTASTKKLNSSSPIPQPTHARTSLPKPPRPQSRSTPQQTTQTQGTQSGSLEPSFYLQTQAPYQSPTSTQGQSQ